MITKNYLACFTESNTSHICQINKIIYVNEEGIKVSARMILVLTCFIYLYFVFRCGVRFKLRDVRLPSSISLKQLGSIYVS